MSTIHVVGLGPGDLTGLPYGTYQTLQSGLPIYLRTEIHPVVEQLRSKGLTFSSFDDLYETNDRFEDVYLQMAQRLVEAAKHSGDIVYAVPGHPLMAERSVQNLLELAGDVTVQIESGQSFLDTVCSALRLDPIEGLLLLDGTALRPDQLQVRLHTLIAQVFHPSVASEVKLTLMEVYPDDYVVTVIRAAGVQGEEQMEQVPLYGLDRVSWIDHLTTVYVPAATDETIFRRDPWYLASLVGRLREPDGCPWDRKQTHESLRRYVIEEAYEVADAIDRDDAWDLASELGDLLLQVFLHAQIASESGEFTVRDVYSLLADKLIRRHPHVFGDKQANTELQANQIWAEVKRTEASDAQSAADESILAGVKYAQPAWQIALSLQKIAAAVGFDWPTLSGVTDKLREEIEELEQAVENGDPEEVEAEFGDLLFSAVNLARFVGVDADRALLRTNQKFERRFRYVEANVRESGRQWKEYSLSDLENFWVEAKTK